ncbi:MAG: hypothetical protein QME64_02425 [bacterium]|nr:hypothetical protein [bacterium]
MNSIIRSSQIIFISSLLLGLGSISFATDWNLAFTTKENCAFSNVTVADHELIVRHNTGWFKRDITALTSLLPAETHIDALDYLYGPTVGTTTTHIVFSLAEDAVLPGAGLVADEDLLLWNGVAISLLWKGSANGVPAEANVDAVDVVALGATTTFSLSFGEAVTLPTVGLVQKSDVVRWTAGTGYSATKDFDGVLRGVPLEANIDGFSRETTANVLILSTDILTQFGGTGTWYGKSDLINFYTTTTTFALRIAGTTLGIPAEVNINAVEVRATEIPVHLSRFSAD